MALATLAAACGLGHGLTRPSGHKVALRVVKSEASRALSMTTLPATITLKSPVRPGTTAVSTPWSSRSKAAKASAFAS
eukprot:scaffold26104_cov122-Isochrysis_galbana.AAC.8